MASDRSSLLSLENLMDEFFSIGTSNERKRQIEELLNSFSQQRDAWKHCLYFMANTSNQFVMMYCMTVLENVINKRWIGLQGQDKMEIRSTLNSYLLSHHDQVPTFIRNKLVKLVVDIGRLDWPHFYPDFFTSILQLVQSSDTAALGLVLLQTTSEELACPREDLCVARKEELQRLLLAQIPTVLGFINGILESLLEKHRHLVAATPPPSPTHGQPTDLTRAQSLSLFSSSPVHAGSLLSEMFKSPASKIQIESLPPMDASSHSTAVLALNCLAHLFSWIPLSTTITSSLLSTIFHFAGFGCEVSQSRDQSSPGSSFSSDTQSLGVLAMCCINELLSKNCVPQEFEDFLLQMFQQTFHLLQRLTKESALTPSGNRLAQLDDVYLEKFTEFIHLFVSVHLRRFESNNQFPVLEFLALLFKYTFKQPNNEGFFSCLDIWTIFLDYLCNKLESRSVDKDVVLERYKEALVSLVTHILQKLQFRFNQSQLEEMDDETLDDESETEWSHFLKQCLEMIAKVADLIPDHTFKIVYNYFQDNIEVYFGVEQYIVNGVNGRRLNITSENECRRLHCSLRDLSSMMQSLGRLAEHYIGEHFMERFSDSHKLNEKLVHMCTYGTKMKLYEVNSIAGKVLQADFVETHAQALAAMKANASWLSQFFIGSCQHAGQQRHCADLITSLLEAIVPLFDKDVPDKVRHSAAHLLLSLMTTVRGSFLLQLTCIQSLFNSVSQGAVAEFSIEVQFLVYRALSHYLLLPWPNVSESEQNWDMRSCHHQAFLLKLTAKYCLLKNSTTLAENKPLQEEATPVVKQTLQVLTDLVESITEEGVSKSKQICYQSLQESVQVTLILFPVYIHQPDVTDEILGFFYALFRGLRVQMGLPFTEQILRTFLGMFTREQLTETILHESNIGYKVIDKFLKILELIVQEPGSSFKGFLPTIISVCMEQIYPIVAERPSSEIKFTLYCLLREILINKWRYFFKSRILSGHGLQSKNEEIENQNQFSSIMQAFGQSFLQPDIVIFRQNLESLENLNTRYKLFHKKIFQELMLNQFLNVLIQVLLHKSHDLLQEEIGITVYNMASVNFDNFYSEFLPQFLNQCEGLDTSQKTILASNFKLDKDLPSFTQSIHRFVNDLRYYKLCNTSLPDGSVKF